MMAPWQASYMMQGDLERVRICSSLCESQEKIKNHYEPYAYAGELKK